jgi:site-specific DNA-methyltransferase (adenine-specific)
MRTQTFKNGIAVHGSFGSPEIQNYLLSLDKFPLVISDPPYGNIVPDGWDKYSEEALCASLISWSNQVKELLVPGGSYYCYGGIGKPNDRPFFRFLSIVEKETGLQMRNMICWKKCRAYGKKDDYLFTREEIAWFVNGEKPAIFNIPLLDTKRGYAGYNKKYPAKSEFYRRTNVFTDINEIFKGKLHVAHKPEKLAEVFISTHTHEGMTILDPFAGSGSSAVAALNLKRKFVVIEKDPETFDKMCARLTALNA